MRFSLLNVKYHKWYSNISLIWRQDAEALRTWDLRYLKSMWYIALKVANWDDTAGLFKNLRLETSIGECIISKVVFQYIPYMKTRHWGLKNLKLKIFKVHVIHLRWPIKTRQPGSTDFRQNNSSFLYRPIFAQVKGKH